MKKKKVLSILLAFVLAISLSVPSLAADLPQTTEELDKQQTVVTTDDSSLDSDAGSEPEQEKKEVESDEELGQAVDLEESEKKIETKDTAEETKTVEPQTVEEGTGENDVSEPQTSDKWTVEDFTYTEMQQTLNGCDYTRQFVIKGRAIAGFSESGEKKLESNKNLVLPSTDNNGEALVGVADSAFKGKGLTSVKFPEGMLVDYDDTVTHAVTRRGNFIVGTSSFANNELTDVYLPEGVIAIMPSAFKSNQIANVSIPRTIWWIENSCFAYNNLTTVGFPKTCDFQAQIHAFAFAHNNIKWVRLPDYIEVVEKKSFYWNPGMEECPTDAPEKEQGFGGVVWMYTDNEKLASMERIHHIERTAESQHSWHQRLIVGETPVEDSTWTVNDFTIEGTVITGLSESGIEKRKTERELVLPDKNKDGQKITEIAATTNSYGLFASETEGFERVILPTYLEKIGQKAFAQNGLKKVSFPSTLKEIGLAAFQMNHLESVILPDSVTTVGGGAFATNPEMSTLILSKNLTEITSGAFGCSDANNYMENLTELTIPEGVTKIGQNAFAGNNIKNIVIPSTVKEIGNLAFSTKNKLMNKCTLTLPEGLEKIGSRAFRNLIIEEVDLPSTVTALKANTFEKEYSDDTEKVKTKVYVSMEQYADKTNFPESTYHECIVKLDPNDTEWNAFDFTYGTWEEAGLSESDVTMYPATAMENTLKLNPYFVTGFSENGLQKIEKNKNLVIPATDPDGKKVTGVGPKAFYKNTSIESVTFPEGVMTTYDGPEGIIADGLTERGDFYIAKQAFDGCSSLTEADFTEGVIRIGLYAFRSTKLKNVSFPHTLWWIENAAFAKSTITNVSFEECDFHLNIMQQAFMTNQIKAVKLPTRTEYLQKFAFMQNPGMELTDESVCTGTWKAQKGYGTVWMYADPSVATQSFVHHYETVGANKSYAQKLITDEEMPDELKPWNAQDFTYSEDGTTITGLTESGIARRKNYPEMVMPDTSPDGVTITAIADAEASASYGLFGADGEEITSVKLPANLEKIGATAFAGNGIQNISFPETLKEIGNYAFRQNNLTEIVLPDSVTKVGDGVFASNFTVEKVKLSNSLTEIPSGFLSCSGQDAAEKFTELTIPEGITTIGANAFAGNNLSKLVIPKGVKEIGASAFAQTQACRSLTEIVLPEGLESLGGRWTFRYAKVTEVELPSTLKELHKDVFRDCPPTGEKVKLYTSNKEHLVDTKTFAATTSTYHEVVYSNLVGAGWSFDDFTFEGSKVTGWSEKGNQTRLNNKNLVIPMINPETGEEITSIGNEAFKIPDSEVEQLKDSVDSPNGMKTVVIPDTVKELGQKAFEYNSFTEITLPEGLTTIGMHAFHGNQLQSVSVPDSVTDIQGGAFAENNITSVKLPKELKKIEAGVFSMNIRLEHIDIPDTVTEIGDMAFAGARLTSLEIPKSVTKIGRKAFHLHHLSELTIPGNVKEIGDSAFEGTFKAITLKKLVLEEGIETIGSLAFREGYLESVKLPNSLKSLAADAFDGNAGTNNDHVVVCYTENRECLDWTGDTWRIELQGKWDDECFTYEDGSVTGLSDIGKALIKNNPSVVIPAKSDDGTAITEVAAGAFENSGMKSVTLPASLTTIGAKAFAGNALTSVAIPNKVTSVAKDAFSGNNGTVTLAVSDRTVLANLKKAGIEGVSFKDASAPIRVTNIKITGVSKKIAAGKKVTLKAVVAPSNADNKAVTWKSSNKKVATVNSKGVVTMKKKSGGKKVTITATASDGSGVKATYVIKSMKSGVKKIKISGAKSVKAGKSIKLKAKVTASKGANKKVTWTSSNTKYAKVSASGKVKTYKAGKGKKVKITVKATDGSNKKKTVTIKIK